MDNKRKLALVKEARRRKLLGEYETNFERFAKDQVKIITKDAAKGFTPFIFNEAQQEINRQLEQQLKEKGRVRALILKARQQGISTYCTARTAWKSYFTPNARSVVMAHDSATSDALFSMSKNLID
jgi:protein-L-isoaspartate O-methyltransferase